MRIEITDIAFAPRNGKLIFALEYLVNSSHHRIMIPCIIDNFTRNDGNAVTDLFVERIAIIILIYSIV